MTLVPTNHKEIIYTITVILFFVSSMTTFDKRMIQAKRQGFKPEREIPDWTGLFIFVEYGLLITLFIFNWKWAILIYVLFFILAVLPVLEIIGNLIYGLMFNVGKLKK